MVSIYYDSTRLGYNVPGTYNGDFMNICIYSNHTSPIIFDRLSVASAHKKALNYEIRAHIWAFFYQQEETLYIMSLSETVNRKERERDVLRAAKLYFKKIKYT